MSRLSYQDRGESTIDEFKVELALLRRDLVERLRRIEEYITFLESDIGRLRLDIQRINDKLSDLAGKEGMPYRPEMKPQPVIKTQEIEQPKVPMPQPQSIQEQAAQPATPPQPQIQIKKTSERNEVLNQTEIAIIKYLIENPGTKSATPIASAINKAREHVARTLKKLADEKKIIRDETTWPYTYVVPEEIKKLVMGEAPSAQL